MTVHADCVSELLPRDEARRLIRYATLAPSVHNTQPWRWRIDDDVIELYADQDRLLPVEDPLGRNLVISCGAALHHLVLAAETLGWHADVERPTGLGAPSLLARVRLTPTELPLDSTPLVTMRYRRTDRRRFTSWPIPDQRLEHLARIASEHGCLAVPLLDNSTRLRMEFLVGTAFAAAARDREMIEEQGRWVDHSRGDGIPSQLVPVDSGDALRNRFGAGFLDDRGSELESSDGVIVLGGVSDDAESWLRTGEGLSALWRAATEGDLSVVPLSQPIEVEHTRSRLRREVLGGLVTPHLVLRLGWQAIGRSQLPESPRRPLGDVIDL